MFIEIKAFYDQTRSSPLNLTEGRRSR